MIPLKKSRTHTTGFTIVELLIVIVVIGVLAAITIVAYNGVQERARISNATSALSQAAKKLAVYQVDYPGIYPADKTDLEGIGIKDSATITYQYTRTAATPNTYCITATTGTISYMMSTTVTTPQPGGCAGHGVGGATAVTNLVANPSFETGFTGWGWSNTVGYTGAISNTQAFSGASSFAMVAPATEADKYFETNVNLTPGTYTLSGYVYLTSAGTTYLNRDVLFNLATGTGTSNGSTPIYDRSKLNQWQRIERSVTLSTNGIARIRYYGITGATTYFDGVMVTAGSSAPGYADGSSANWVWNGTVHNSTSTGSPL